MDGLGRSFKVLMALKIKSKVNVEQKKKKKKDCRLELTPGVLSRY